MKIFTIATKKKEKEKRSEYKYGTVYCVFVRCRMELYVLLSCVLLVQTE